MLRRPDLVLSKPGAVYVMYLVTNEMMKGVWALLHGRLSVLDTSSSMVEVTVDGATYISKTQGNACVG